VQPQAPEESDAAAEPFDLVLVLNTESCSVWRSLEHFGQVMAWPRDITKRS